MTERMKLEPKDTNFTGEQMSNNQLLLNEILLELGVHAKGEATSPDEGLIASNYFIDTVEKGQIVIRANELGENKGVGFEVKALDFLGKHDAPVPNVLRFNDDSLEKHVDDKRVIAYTPIDGDTLGSDELDSCALATEAGSLLRNMIVPAALYEPDGTEPDGDATFIKGITTEFLDKYPDLADHSFFKDAVANLVSENYAEALRTSPKGIVHADFFYENIIKRDDKLVGIIDFGDAYYGAILNDVVIGAMEFSVFEANEQWKPELFEAFLQPNADWLRKSGIDFDTFQATLLANCLRFAVYTLGFEREDDSSASADENRYIQRYFKFKETLSLQLRKSYETVCD